MKNKDLRVSRFELLMDAGFGAQKAGDILIRAFAHTGRFVYIEPMIPAEISPPARTRPALSGVIIRVAEFDLKNIGNATDLIIAQHEIVLDRRLDDYEFSPTCRILLDMGDKKLNEESYEQTLKRLAKEGLRVFPFEMSAEAAKDILKSLAGKGKNMYYLGMMSRIYNMPEDVMTDEITTMFGKKLKPEILEKNIAIFMEGYKQVEEIMDASYTVGSKPVEEGDKILIDGNSALSMGMIDAGIKLLSGYPITPASSLMHTLAKELPAHGGMVHQAEDEISAIGAAIGSYFGGVPAATATSGPGLSLKQEFIGYAAVAEIPLVIIDVQRSGPSTGMPTKTEQSDLMAAVYGSHGDNTKVVISVGNVIDCFYAPHVARYITEKLRLPVFILSDFQIANSYKVVPKPQPVEMDSVDDIPDFVLKRFGMKRLSDKIEMVRNVQANPGTPDMMRRVTGLNTDETGSVNYFANTNQRSHVVRNEKINHVRRSLNEPEFFGDVKEGDVLVVGWGTTRGAIAEAVHKMQDDGHKVGGLSLRIVYPLPMMLKELFSKFKRVVTVELAYGDEFKHAPLSMFLRSETMVDIKAVLAQATGRPVTPKTVEKAVKEILNDC